MENNGLRRTRDALRDARERCGQRGQERSPPASLSSFPVCLAPACDKVAISLAKLFGETGFRMSDFPSLGSKQGAVSGKISSE